MELVGIYLEKDELSIVKRSYCKMEQEDICMGCGQKYEWMRAYSMIDYDMDVQFIGHKNCLSTVLFNLNKLKLKYGMDRVVQAFADEQGRDIEEVFRRKA